MLSRRTIILLLLLICIIAGAGIYHWAKRPGIPPEVARLLESAEHYELLSVQPFYRGPGSDDQLILGRTAIIDPATRIRLNLALHVGARDRRVEPAACFNPRHAIRLTHAGRVTEFVICFECHQVQVWRDRQKIAEFFTNATPQPAFDAVLRTAGVPLASEMPTTRPMPKGKP